MTFKGIDGADMGDEANQRHFSVPRKHSHLITKIFVFLEDTKKLSGSMRRHQRNKKFAGHETQKSFRTSHLNLSCQMKNFLKFDNIYEYIKIFTSRRGEKFCMRHSFPSRSSLPFAVWKVIRRCGKYIFEQQIPKATGKKTTYERKTFE